MKRKRKEIAVWNLLGKVLSASLGRGLSPCDCADLTIRSLPWDYELPEGNTHASLSV